MLTGLDERVRHSGRGQVMIELRLGGPPSSGRPDRDELVDQSVEDAEAAGQPVHGGLRERERCGLDPVLRLTPASSFSA
jgi:hypothetical protein